MKRIALFSLFITLIHTAPARTQEEEKGSTLECLRWPARHQHADGSWSIAGFARECGGQITNNPAKFPGVCESLKGDTRGDTATTSLVLLSFLGAGFFHQSKSTFDGISYGQVVRKGLKWLMDHQDAEGVFGNREGDWVTHHALATLAMSEAYGLSESTLFKDAAQKAVDGLVSLQNRDGSWTGQRVEWTKEGPFTVREGAGILTTGFALMALKSAELSSLTFDREKVYRKADRYLDRLADPSRKDWSAGHREAAVYVIGKIFMDKQRDQAVPAAVEAILKRPPTARDPLHTWLGGMAVFQYDGPEGKAWKSWNESFKDVLLKSQNKDKGDKKGSWEPVHRAHSLGNRVSVTAMHALSLEVYYR